MTMSPHGLSQRSSLSLLLLLLLLLASVVFAAVADDATPHATAAPYEVADANALLHKPVLQWTVHDVEAWMNETLGYPEYSATLRTHRVDGPTLLALTGADFESYFAVRHPLHVVKFEAHVRLLRARTRARQPRRRRPRRSGDHDDDDDDDDDDAHALTSPRTVWQYMRAHPYRTWMEGVLAMYFPRTAMLTAYVLDRPLYKSIIGDTTTTAVVVVRNDDDNNDSSNKTAANNTAAAVVRGGRWPVWVHRVLYWVGCVFAPDVYMTTLAARVLPGNVAFMLLTMAHLLQQGISEYVFAYAVVRGVAFPPEVPLLRRVWMMYSYALLLPVVACVVPFVLPHVLQCVLAGVLVLHNTLLLLGWVRIVYDDVWCAWSEKGSSSSSSSDATTAAGDKSSGECDNSNSKSDVRHDGTTHDGANAHGNSSGSSATASSANDVVD